MKEASGTDHLHDVLARFPGSEGPIRELYHADEDFRELCGDYAQCLAMLQRLRGQGAERDERIEQYAEMRADLEQELAGRISGVAGA